MWVFNWHGPYWRDSAPTCTTKIWSPCSEDADLFQPQRWLRNHCPPESSDCGAEAVSHRLSLSITRGCRDMWRGDVPCAAGLPLCVLAQSQASGLPSRWGGRYFYTLVPFGAFYSAQQPKDNIEQILIKPQGLDKWVEWFYELRSDISHDMTWLFSHLFFVLTSAAGRNCSRENNDKKKIHYFILTQLRYIKIHTSEN